MACQMSIFWVVCIKVERRKRKLVSTEKIIKQQTIYKTYHLICGVFSFPFLFIFLGGGVWWKLLFCLYDIAALMSNNKGLFFLNGLSNVFAPKPIHTLMLKYLPGPTTSQNIYIVTIRDFYTHTHTHTLHFKICDQ